MSPIPLLPAAAIGSTSFAIVVWGSILLVVAVFGYVAWTVVTGARAD
ncbi:hypothetical protein [Halovivax limisalsi]|nr:hypothetical protein [Halovivax limisalsi]